MKTSVLPIRDMLSVLSVEGVEKRIGEVPGVKSVTVDFDAGKATIRYDETRVNLADIKSDVRQSGYEADAPHSDGNDVHHADVHQTHGAPADPATPHPSSTLSSTKHSATAGGTNSGAGGGKDGAAPPTGATSPASDDTTRQGTSAPNKN